MKTRDQLLALADNRGGFKTVYSVGEQQMQIAPHPFLSPVETVSQCHPDEAVAKACPERSEGTEILRYAQNATRILRLRLRMTFV